MKDQLYTWANKFSIFYNHTESHHLLIQCVRPFITQNAKQLLEYAVFISSIRGEHITVVFKTTTDDTLLEKKFLKKIRRFLSTNPSSTKPVDIPFAGFFMDYPNNSLWLNLNNHAPRAYQKKQYQLIEQSLSNALMEVFGNDEINSDNIDAFLIYMHLATIKSTHASIAVAAKIASELYLHYDSHFKHTLQETISEFNDINLSFSNNKDQIADIILDLWRTEDFDPELKWMTFWTIDCRRFLQGKDFVESFVEISGLIYDHVGISDTSLRYLFTTNLLDLLSKSIGR